MIVRVLEGHIKSGMRKSYNRDAFALAVIDAIVERFARARNSFKIIATNRDVLFIDGYIIWLPDVAQEFIKRSDHNLRLEPTQFELDIPEDLFDPREHQKYE